MNNQSGSFVFNFEYLKCNLSDFSESVILGIRALGGAQILQIAH
jgi:hypothetical protein